MEPINDVVAVRVLSRYVVELTFENGDVRVLDLEPLLDGPVFERHRPAISTGRSGPWCFRRGTFPSVEELIDAIRRYIDAWTERCEPFIWTKDVETILARANRQNELVTGR